MNQLPDRLPTTYVGQPQPTALRPAAVELYGERPVIYVQSAENPQQSVAIYRDLNQTPAVYQPRDLTPQPLIDPMAQRLIAGGVGGGALAAGVGYGLGQAVGALAAGFPVLALFAIAALIATKASSRGRGSTHITQTVHHHNRWWGKSTTNL